MISTKNIKVVPLSRENISLFLTDEQIFRKYITYSFQIDEIFSAPYRKDNHPSFGIYYNNTYNKLMFKDLSKKLGGDCFRYVQIIHNNCSLWEACKIINRDFKLNLGGYSNNQAIDITTPIFMPRIKDKRQISILSQEFTDIDIKYWLNYGISIEILKKYNVFSVKKLFINNAIKRIYTEKFPIYCYYFPRTGNKKIYIPNEDKWGKWDNNASNDWDIQGYDQLPKTGNVIYITKSMKDVMCLYELGCNAVAPHSESSYINGDFIRHLKKRFKHIYSFYDQDSTGIIGAKYLKDTFNIESIFIPENLQCKDISDYVIKYNFEKAKELMLELNGNLEKSRRV